MEDGPPIFKQDFSCPALLNMLTLMFRIQDYHLLRSALRLPRHTGDRTNRLLPVRSPLLGESHLMSIPKGTEMFHFPSFASRTSTRYLPYGKWVSPFRNLRITGYCRLPEAYRRLSRLSSPLTAKASTMCASLLDHTTPSSLNL